MANRRYAIKFSGAAQRTPNDRYHDGKMTVSYCYMFSNADIDIEYTRSDARPLLSGEVEYSDFIPAYKSKDKYGILNPFMLNYKKDSALGLSEHFGAYLNAEEVAASYSIYRREYDIYQKPGVKIQGYFRRGEFYFNTGNRSAASVKMTPRPGYIYIDIPTQYAYQYDFKTQHYVLTDIYKEFKGEWQPVVVNSNTGFVRDYNITSGRSYQYILYPAFTEGYSENKQVFANAEGAVFVEDPDVIGQGRTMMGSPETAHLYGSPVKTNWDEWSIVELIPQNTNDSNAPDTIKKVYKANLDQLWLFKYSLETGGQTQNISRTEFQTLGQYPKFGYGKMNYASGDVSALLGSEIIPYNKKQRYIERLSGARVNPLSTNEKIEMLKQWRKLVNSKNPKLLKDIKGQSWIVQIMGSSNKPQNFYQNQPDTISFQWKEIGSTDNVIIYGDGGYKDFEEQEGSQEWESVF